MKTIEHPAVKAKQHEMVARPKAQERIGDLIRRRHGLTDAQVDQVARHQRENNLRFGEAVVALDLARPSDVKAALSEQLFWNYAPGSANWPGNPELVVCADPFGDKAEAFLDLRMQLLAGVMTEESTHALAIVSPDIGDGKSYVAANLAASFSQLGGKTLLIDANMRAPRQHELLDSSEIDGVSTVLCGRTESNVIYGVDNVPGLYLMGAGPKPPQPLHLLQTPRFNMLMYEVMDKFDHVLIDTPAFRQGADARLIAARAGAALVIGRKGHSSMGTLQSMFDKLLNASVKIAGVVMNEH
jgi:protein-tyrosine kinase